MKNKKKTVIIIAIIIAVVAIGAVVGVVAYNNYATQQQIEQSIGKYNAKYEEFKTEKDRDKKLLLLTEFIEDAPATSDEIIFEAINPEYNSILNQMRKFFADEYDNSIKENTIESLKDSEDEDIKNSITNLVDLKDLINKESDVTIGNEETLKDYNDQINGLIKSMRDYFIEQYDLEIKNNTLKDVDKIDDKSKLEKAVENLNKFKDSLNKEANTTLADDEKLKSYNKTIND